MKHFSSWRSVLLASLATLPWTAQPVLADAEALRGEIVAATEHADTAGDFVYALSPGFEECVLTLTETETEASAPDSVLRTTTITIDLGKVAPGGIAAAGDNTTFVTITMGDGAEIGYTDSYAYGRIDKLDEPVKTLDIAADAATTPGLVEALAALAEECRGGGGGSTVAGGGTTTEGGTTGGGWGLGGTAGGGTTTGGETDPEGRRAPGSSAWGAGGGGTAEPTPAPGGLVEAPTPTPEPSGGGTEADAWDAALAADTIEGYETYIANHPDGEHILDALQRIAAISAGMGGPGADPTPGPDYSGSGTGTGTGVTIGTNDELALWQEARATDSISAYETYLRSFPEGEFAILARARIGELGGSTSGGGGSYSGGGGAGGASELELWRAARLSDAIADYQAYLDAFPNGEFAQVARDRIEALGGTVGGGGSYSGGGGSTGGGGGYASEPDMWRTAILSDALADYQAYLAAYPDGEHAEQARKRIEALGGTVGGGGSYSGGGGSTGGGGGYASEPDMWRTAILSDALADYQAYLAAYPDGEHAEQARKRIEALGGTVGGGGSYSGGGGSTGGGGGYASEPDMWRTAILSDALADYQAYIAAYPDGEHAEQARKRIEALGGTVGGGGSYSGGGGSTGGGGYATESDMWRAAILSDDPVDYQAYLSAYPDGEHAEQARSRLRALGIEPQALRGGSGGTRGLTIGGQGTGSTGGTAERIAPGTGPDLEAAKRAEDALGLNKRQRRQFQQRLKLMGYNPGPVDGIIGTKTRNALKEWQEARGYAVTGFLDAVQKDALWSESQASYDAWSAARRTAEPAPTVRRYEEPAPTVRRAPAGNCPRRGDGTVVPGVSAECDAIGAMEGIGGILGN